MAYFTQDYLDFFSELRINNSKLFFDENRKRYEKHVKEPFKDFVSDLLIRTQEIDPEITMEAKHAIFRINRDIRFSKDKTPYKTYKSAGFSKGGKKSNYAGFYFGLSNTTIYIGGGSWGMEKEAVNAIRNEIHYSTEEYLNIVNNKEFQKMTGGLKGDSLKRIPKEYKDTFELAPDIARKAYYYMQEYNTPKIALKDNFMDVILNHYRAAMPLNHFLKKALD